MIWVGGSLKIGLMTGVTGRRGVHVTGGMTGNAGERSVCSSQNECSSIMIKGCRRPGGSIVAIRASLVEII